MSDQKQEHSRNAWVLPDESGNVLLTMLGVGSDFGMVALTDYDEVALVLRATSEYSKSVEDLERVHVVKSKSLPDVLGDSISASTFASLDSSHIYCRPSPFGPGAFKREILARHKTEYDSSDDCYMYIIPKTSMDFEVLGSSPEKATSKMVDGWKMLDRAYDEALPMVFPWYSVGEPSTTV